MANLRIPGPTPLPDAVLEVQSRQMIDHRGPEFGEILTRVTANLKTLFQTKNDVLMLTGSGTGAMEASVANLLSPGEKVMVVNIGGFGDRFVSIIKAFGANPVPVNFEWGRAADPEVVRRELKANPDVTTVFVTQNETSTGVTNPLKEISAVVKEFDKLIVVDAISGIGSIRCAVDEWNLDVVLAGSQKGWMASPGIAMVSLSERAWQKQSQAKLPRFYWDFKVTKEYAQIKQPPWTPAVSVIFGLDVGLQILIKEGLENIIARHERIGRMTREGVKALGFKIFADERYASNTVTAVLAPEGFDVRKYRRIIDEEYNVVLATGQGKIASKTFRIGHMGLVSEKDIENVLASMKSALPKMGYASAKV